MGTCGRFLFQKNRNKGGKCFGFIRFTGVDEPRRLEERLNQLWIGSYKLIANLSRLQRVMGHVEMVDKERSMHVKHNLTKVRDMGHQVVPGVRFVDAVKNQVWKQKRSLGDRRQDGKEWTGLEFIVKDEDMAWLQNCYVGKVHSLDDVITLQSKIMLAGLSSLVVKPMGVTWC